MISETFLNLKKEDITIEVDISCSWELYKGALNPLDIISNKQYPLSGLESRFMAEAPVMCQGAIPSRHIHVSVENNNSLRVVVSDRYTDNENNEKLIGSRSYFIVKEERGYSLSDGE